MTASEYLDIIAPQFIANPNKNNFISIARLVISQSTYQDKYEYAVALRAAHEMTCSTQAQSSTSQLGDVKSITEHDLRVEYNVSGGDSQNINSSRYGKMLGDLMNTIITYNVVT